MKRVIVVFQDVKKDCLGGDRFTVEGEVQTNP